MIQLDLNDEDESESAAAALVAGLLFGFMSDPTTPPSLKMICHRQGHTEEHAERILATLRRVEAYFNRVADLQVEPVPETDTLQ